MTNSQQLEDLAWAIEASAGEFKLILVKCNYLNLQTQLIEELQKICSVEIQILQLQISERTLYNAIREEFNDQIQALMIVGWESLPNLSQMLSSANQVREEFRSNCRYPVVLWINDQIYQQIMESATDLESWGITINFTIPNHQLINFLKLTIEKILNDDLNVNLQEIELALQDLQKIGQDLEPDFTANCDFLRGFIEYNNKQLNTAIIYYQQSLDFWQTTDNLEIQGRIFYNLTICNYENSQIKTEVRESGEIKDYVQQTLERFENSQRLDLVASSLTKFGLILEDLEEWTELQKLATQALEIHQAENNILKIAEDYTFLAKAIFAQSNFSEAEKIANQGLNTVGVIHGGIRGVIHELPLQDFYRQSLFLLLAQSQEKLQQHEQAIKNLELAKDIGIINNQPKLYVKILNLLQQLFFEKTDYLEAFNTKLESRSIEQQFGLRAFIGAGWLKPSKNTSLVNKDNISLEIEASGRKIDVDKLLESIGRYDKKIIVIHGQSGVGKSSLVNAGLIPALENKAIGFKDNLPVTIRVYNSWFTELKRELLNVLPERFKPEDLKLDSQEEFISQLVEIEKNNLRTVLIFDQFEEFFFVCPDDKARTEFFQFLGKCLDKNKNIGSLRVILSLRVDYLHLLLECDEIPDMNIIGDGILSKNVLYKLGNLTPENAKTTIERLTKKTTFQLKPDLINRLVEDLAGELGSVRPIELQVVGAQLETEKITTLAAYQECGNKQKLVKRYLGEIVKDCGDENQELAELLLYFLTDEQGTRPLKTKVELERDLKSLLERDQTQAEKKLDLVLEIFVKSGLVVLLPENPCERYQLVHDYLALFIRQQQEPKLKAVIAELEREKQQRKIGEAKLNRVLKFALAGSIAAGVGLTGLTVTAWNAAQRAETQKQQAAINEIQALTKSSEAQFALGNTGSALIESLKAGGKLKLASSAKSDTQVPTIAALRQAVYLQRHEEKEKRALNVNTLKGHEGYVRSVVFSRDGKQLASGSYDKTIKIWDVTTGKVLNTLKGHEGLVNSVGFSPDGKQLASGSDDKTIKIWDMTTGKVLNTLKGYEGSVNSVGFSPDGKQLAYGSDDRTIKIWDVTTGKVLKGYEGVVTSVGFSPDGKQLASGSDDKTIKIWDVTTGKVLNTLPSERYANKGHESSVNSVVFSPDGKQLASGSLDNTIKIWDMTRGKVLNTLKGHDSSSGVSWVNSVVFSPDSKQLASGSHDKTIKIWDMTRGKVLNTLKGHDSSVNSVVFSPDGKQLASGSSDNTVKIWDMTTGKVLHTLKGHDNWVNSVVFSPDSKQLASGSLDNTIILWDLNLDNLVTSGCDLLNNYLIGNPQVLAELKDCQTPSRLLLAATALVVQGENLAENDDMNAAVANFRTAKTWDKKLTFDPQAKAQEFANKGQAKRLVTEGESLVKEGKVKEAIAAYTEAQKLDHQVEITASSWDTLCKYGSLKKQAAEVMFACEKAVKLSPNDGYIRDSRGLARALTGDYNPHSAP